MSLPDHGHNKIEQPATRPQEEDHMPARNVESPAVRTGLAFVIVMAVLATMVGIVLLWPEAVRQDLLPDALTVVLVFAALIAGAGRFSAIRDFFRRKRRPAGAKKPSITKSSVRETAEEERHPLRNGDGIPHAHLWWF